MVRSNFHQLWDAASGFKIMHITPYLSHRAVIRFLQKAVWHVFQIGNTINFVAQKVRK
jgi:hypothetical protein